MKYPGEYSFCIHAKSFGNGWDEPKEISCPYGDEYDCEDCPDRYSEDDYYADLSDYEYERRMDELLGYT